MAAIKLIKKAVKFSISIQSSTDLEAYTFLVTKLLYNSKCPSVCPSV